MSKRLYSQEQDAVIAERFQARVPLSKIRQEFGGSLPTIRQSLKRSGVYEQRPGGKPDTRHRVWSDAEVDAMVEMWNNGVSKSALARQFHTKSGQVEKLLGDRGIATIGARPFFRNAIGEGHPAWKGGRIYYQVDGVDTYVGVRVNDPTDEIAWPMRSGNSYVLEHRLVMARFLGRPLLKSEQVHHIDGNGLNNDLSNLQLRHGNHGTGVVMVCGDCGSRNLVSAPIADPES